ncbi:hypothetical protein QBC40DRAFT_300413 [Triangularia verruculosa]|uniref:Kelch repeat-containing protein n=1 Tax=Triangularia verruculosa TaxID=2587418 RepID=A0AAN6XA71_9PEZI|nr:hypothetical protein QBC40DRAFT_300413 [Triangularia verruculosa]
MFAPNFTTLVIWALSTSMVVSQSIWRTRNQINTTLCQWNQLRAAVIRDRVFLDGGRLWWRPGLSDGQYANVVGDENPYGITWTLNFSRPFNTNENVSALFVPIYALNGAPVNNLAPNYVSGALLHNDFQYFGYGGVTGLTDALSDPSGTTVRGYRAFSSLLDDFQPSSLDNTLGNGITRYVAYGGAASAPSENLAWYFSGLRSRTGGIIYDPEKGGNNETTLPNHVSNVMITLNLEKELRPEWTSKNLTGDVPGRANPELVWVPVGSKGILVALGGVVDPVFISINNTSADKDNNREQSPEFMSTIDIYDVAGDRWYRQKTTGGPGALTRGCAVVASAQDSSSFSIYYYGGYAGLDSESRYSDDVWVLSLPSFTWTKLTAGTGKGRAAHRCVMPYPDQMMVIGGQPPMNGKGTIPCLEEPIRVYNLSSGTWMNRYDPAVWANYTVPEAVRDKIRGSPTSGAEVTKPSPLFVNTALASVFAARYDQTKIKTYYPYPPESQVNNTNPNAPPVASEEAQGGGNPSWLGPVVGVVVALVVLTLIGVGLFLWRRRKYLGPDAGAKSEAGTENTRTRVLNWIPRPGPAGPGPASPPQEPEDVKPHFAAGATEYHGGSVTDVDSVGAPTPFSISEMMNTEVRRPVELPDSSGPAELHDNPTSHPENSPYSPFDESPAVGRGSVNKGTSYLNNTHQTDHASNILSLGSTPPPPPPQQPATMIPEHYGTSFYRPDSDALGNPPVTTPTSGHPTNGTSSTLRNQVFSGISNLSDRDRSHLRQISDTTVSSITSGHQPGIGQHGQILSHSGFPERLVESPAVVSPPTTGPMGESPDYLSARPLPGQAQAQQWQAQQAQAANSPLRKSVFTESKKDMTDPNEGPGPGRAIITLSLSAYYTLSETELNLATFLFSVQPWDKYSTRARILRNGVGFHRLPGARYASTLSVSFKPCKVRKYRTTVTAMDCLERMELNVSVIPTLNPLSGPLQYSETVRPSPPRFCQKASGSESAVGVGCRGWMQECVSWRISPHISVQDKSMADQRGAQWMLRRGQESDPLSIGWWSALPVILMPIMIPVEACEFAAKRGFAFCEESGG